MSRDRLSPYQVFILEQMHRNVQIGEGFDGAVYFVKNFSGINRRTMQSLASRGFVRLTPAFHEPSLSTLRLYELTSKGREAAEAILILREHECRS